MGYSRTLEVGSSYLLSDSLLSSNDALKAITWNTYSLTKSISIVKEVYSTCSFRFKFDLSSGGGTTFAKIYHNGVAVGSEKSKAGGWVTSTDDITISNMKANDSLELWTYNDVSNGSCQNFRVYGTETLFFNSVV